MFENRRKYPRVPLAADIAVRMKGQLLQGTVCTNISMGGMCISFNNHFDEGTLGKVWLTQNYPDESIVFEADFRKLWVKPITLDKSQKRMGVSFAELYPQHRDSLWRIVRRQSSQARQIT
jgi:c-di-GMP-binding flagellar brake protein YcgR